MTIIGRAGSLRVRLLLATMLALVVALTLAGIFLAGQFREHVERQFSSSLVIQLDQITARLEFDAQGEPQIDTATLSDPRWARPYSGLYWQIDAAGPLKTQQTDAQAASSPRPGVLRSRSLWDTLLRVPADTRIDGSVHRHRLSGPDQASLLLVSRTIHTNGDATKATAWRVMVAADQRESDAAIASFTSMLAVALMVLMLLLAAAALAQVAVGLKPLQALHQGLANVQSGSAQRLEGRFPSEVQPLVDSFNSVLTRNAEIVSRARTQAGNLAHAIKTPLAAMAQAAATARQHPGTAGELALLVDEQVGLARRHVDWHLARSRAAAAQGLPGARVELSPVVDGLIRVMHRVHAERGLVIEQQSDDPGLAFAGEAQDLQEMLGNLLDNACQWATRQVQVHSARVPGAAPDRLSITIDDDGPGIEPAQRDAALRRGTRLDETTPGSGLGLAIVQELGELYGGSLDLQAGPLGGLRVVVVLPATITRSCAPPPARSCG